jgi:hypothetical protein
MIVCPSPFRHAILHDYWDESLLAGVSAEFPLPSDPRWHRFANSHERKLGGNDAMWGTRTWRLFDDLEDPAFLSDLQESFGIGAPLTMDDVGGGYHLIPPGGFLASHVDFNKQQDGSGRWRRLNLIIFLNRNWDESYGGQLILGAADDVVIEPRWNTTAIFETHDQSWHGHPVPTSAGFWRRSVAAYFYSDEPPLIADSVHDTVWLTP